MTLQIPASARTTKLGKDFRFLKSNFTRTFDNNPSRKNRPLPADRFTVPLVYLSTAS